ncbi:hypothetical protein [Streptomyces alkaliphilus]|uniref:hypothetical protein n=1 Tax=Streptomyces alkaliphilus TaxID=1472722 RepID=UPI0012974A37|nr:hypothetical protein [Streptomyces alkaliphilus]
MTHPARASRALTRLARLSDRGGSPRRPAELPPGGTERLRDARRRALLGMKALNDRDG